MTPGQATLWGVEIDAEAAAMAQTELAQQGCRAHLLAEDFFALHPGQIPRGFHYLLNMQPTVYPTANFLILRHD